MRRYVRQRKHELGLARTEVFVPQSYRLGPEAQLDWYEATVKLGGEPRKLYIFAMRSMASGDAFHRAYRHATQQALLEAHEYAFQYFSGVFATSRQHHPYASARSTARRVDRLQRTELTLKSLAFLNALRASALIISWDFTFRSNSGLSFGAASASRAPAASARNDHSRRCLARRPAA